MPKAIEDRIDGLSALERDVYSLLVRTLRQTVKGNTRLAARLRRMTIRTAKRALEEKPTARLWVILGDVYTSWKRSAQAYESALRLEPGNTEALLELATIDHVWRRDLSSALRRIRRVLRNPPAGVESETYRRAADIYEVCGRLDDARRMRRRHLYWDRSFQTKTVADLDPDWHKPDPLDGDIQRQRGKRVSLARGPASRRSTANESDRPGR